MIKKHRYKKIGISTHRDLLRLSYVAKNCVDINLLNKVTGDMNRQVAYLRLNSFQSIGLSPFLKANCFRDNNIVNSMYLAVKFTITNDIYNITYGENNGDK